MRDEQAGQALASPRSNVKTLRELFNDKDARSTPRVASVKRPTEQAPSRVVPSQQEPPRAVSSSDLREDSPSPKAVVDRPASASCEAPCEEEEDYETPISLSKPPEPPRRETVASSQPRCEEVCLPKPVEGSSQRTKPKLPEPPLYVPAQFVHHPVVSGWLRRKLPTATACPPKPVRPSGMRLLHSSLQNIAPSAAQLDRPLPPNRSPLPLAPPQPEHSSPPCLPTGALLPLLHLLPPSRAPPTSSFGAQTTTDASIVAHYCTSRRCVLRTSAANISHD
ncbi:hypothetical protein MTO96_048620 [Rhipicephalus appendiculatus]